MGAVYAIANQKGGVGKTTTAINLAAVIAEGGHQTLLVDLDSQANATVGLGLAKDLAPSSYDCLIGRADAAAALKPTAQENLWVVPATADLAGAAVELAGVEGAEEMLKRSLEGVRARFACTLLDCPPSLGPITVNALAAADRVIVPVQAEYFALEGLVQFLETVRSIQASVNPALTVAGVVVTMKDSNTRLSSDVEREVREHLAGYVFDAVIPRNVRIAEAPSYGLPVTGHAPDSSGAEAYRALAREVIEGG